MNRYIGIITRLLAYLFLVAVQIGFVQTIHQPAHPWINLPLILLLWSAVQKKSPTPLLIAGGVGALLDLGSAHAFGVYILSHVLAVLTVMIISAEWLDRRGTGNRVLIGLGGLLMYGVVWITAELVGGEITHQFFSPQLLLEILAIWLSFTLLKGIRPIWNSLIKPRHRYA